MEGTGRKFEERFYRRVFAAEDLWFFRICVKESDLYVGVSARIRRHRAKGGMSVPTLREVGLRETEEELKAQVKRVALERLARLRQDLEHYLARHPRFATAYSPCDVFEDAPPLAKEMAGASRLAGVGPMAAVAGAIADDVGEFLVDHVRLLAGGGERSHSTGAGGRGWGSSATGQERRDTEVGPPPGKPKDLTAASELEAPGERVEVVVENGGDIYLSTRRPRVVALFAGDSPFSMRVGIKVRGREKPYGICTSAGTVGPSASFGTADAACVVADRASVADAFATALGNRVRAGSGIHGALDWFSSLAAERPVAGLAGCVVVHGTNLGAWGDLELVDL